MLGLSLQKSLRNLLLLVGLCSQLLLAGCEYAYTGSGFKVLQENPNEEPWFSGYRPADMAEAIEARGELLPVIVWANGGCFRSDFPWQPLFKNWAAAGYVVLALSEAPANQGGALGQTNVADHGALIDWDIQKSPYNDMLDHDRIVAAGNSCGGITALGLTAQDPRVSAVFVLSGSSAIGSSSRSVMEAIDVPVGYVIGGSTDIAGGPARTDYERMSQDIPAMVVNRTIGGHVTVSTTASILEEVAQIGLNWMELVLYGSPEAYDEPTADTVCAECTPGDWNLMARLLDTLL